MVLKTMLTTKTAINKPFFRILTIGGLKTDIFDLQNVIRRLFNIFNKVFNKTQGFKHFKRLFSTHMLKTLLKPWKTLRFVKEKLQFCSNVQSF